VFVNTNGILSFDSGVKPPMNGWIPDVSGIAPFWTDIDTTPRDIEQPPRTLSSSGSLPSNLNLTKFVNTFKDFEKTIYNQAVG
jgi:hypothetical protein